MLNDLGIPASRIGSKKERVRIALHHRIQRLEKKRPKLKHLCDGMTAVRHLGNAGSHPGITVAKGDVFDGFDILEQVLQEIYSSHIGPLTKTVRSINKRKGPRKK